ncbi:MAG TPA: hypothetical protein VK586_15980 [Streptosporangiaceae bacterium]|nr:hypothetical protein [Streptosporangiaceae bacterium]
MSEPRKARTPLLERTVPFLRLPADLVAAAAVFGLLSTVGGMPASYDDDISREYRGEEEPDEFMAVASIANPVARARAAIAARNHHQAAADEMSAIRAQAVASMVGDGMTWREVGEALDLSAARIGQILHDYQDHIAKRAGG